MAPRYDEFLAATSSPRRSSPGPAGEKGSRLRCPVHQGKGLSLHAWDAGDAVGLKCFAHECSYGEILTAAGFPPGGKSDEVRPKSYAPSKPRSGAGEWSGSTLPAGDPTHATLGRPDQSWEIRDEEGRLFGLHCRWDLSDRKELRWWRNGRWSLDGLKTAQFPLYGSEKATSFDSSRPVVVVEGERTTDALEQIGVQALGTVTGASGTPSHESLKVLAGRKVILWPDADEPGQHHMQRIATALAGACPDLRLFAPPDLPPGGDAVEWLEAQGDERPERLREILEGSGEPVTIDPPTEVRGARPTAPPAWPSLHDQALQGLAGDFVRLVSPHTEADPMALLVQFLAAFGSVVGPAPHIRVGATFHRGNLFLVLVGQTSKARKGTSWDWVRQVFKGVDSDWSSERQISGLSSGEGLIWAVRDPETSDGVTTESGVDDKRLLVVEGEFASTLKVLSRRGNTLSAILRNAWDGKPLQTLTKNSPARATGAYVSIIAHVTKEELVRLLSSTEAGNGFGNRFLWICVKRARILPFGGDLNPKDLEPLVRRLREAVDFSRRQTVLGWSEEAEAIWRQVYPELSEGKLGLLGAMIARAEAQVLRLALLYALLDQATEVEVPHLLAALAVWDYADSSAHHIFGEALGDPVADEILRHLRASPTRLKRKKIHQIFNRHKSAGEIQRALDLLESQGLVICEMVPTGGRPAETWKAVSSEKSELSERSPRDTPLSSLLSLNSRVGGDPVQGLQESATRNQEGVVPSVLTREGTDAEGEPQEVEVFEI